MQNRLETKLDFSSEEIASILKYFPNGVCAFDMEMTGLSPLLDKIIEIAACRINPDGTWDKFHAFINPLISIPEHTIAYHGLTNEDLRDAPSLKRPLKEFIDFYGNLPLIAHNATFDASFLIRGIHQYNYPISLSDIYDSVRFARGVFKKHPAPPENFKLGTLAKFFEFEFSHHQALDDAMMSLKVFERCIKELEKKKATSQIIKGHAFLFKLQSFLKAENYLLPNKLKGIEDLVTNKEKIFIRYKGGSIKGYRPVKPISLLPMPQGLILYGECLKTNMNKYFRVAKIQKFSVIGEEDAD